MAEQRLCIIMVADARNVERHIQITGKITLHARLARMVMHLPPKQENVGSIPTACASTGAINKITSIRKLNENDHKLILEIIQEYNTYGINPTTEQVERAIIWSDQWNIDSLSQYDDSKDRLRKHQDNYGYKPW